MKRKFSISYSKGRKSRRTKRRKSPSSASAKYKRSLATKKRRTVALRRALRIESKKGQSEFNMSLLGFDGATNQATIDDNNQEILDPVINQGTGQRDRIGNKVTLTSCWLKYALFLNGSGQGGVPYPVLVRFVFYYQKDDPTSLPQPYQNADLFQLGNSDQGFYGSISDHLMQFNTDKYRILKVKSFKLGFANNQGTGGSAASQYFANNDYKMTYVGHINLLPMLLKDKVFNDNMGVSMGRKLYFLAYVTYANSSSMVSTVRPCSLMCQLRWSFTDA